MNYRRKGEPIRTHYQDDITRMLRAIGADDTYTHRELIMDAWAKHSYDVYGNGWRSLDDVIDAEIRNILFRYIEQTD